LRGGCIGRHSYVTYLWRYLHRQTGIERIIIESLNEYIQMEISA